MFRPKGIKVAVPRSYAKIEELAAFWRVGLLPDLAWTDGVDAHALFDALDRRPIRLPGGVPAQLSMEVQPLPAALEAYTLYDSGRSRLRVVLSESTYASLEQGDPRAAFTLLHELGHVVMHKVELVKLQSMPHPERVLARQVATHKIYEDSEWQADAFASAFLMPALGLQRVADDGRITVAALQKRYQVSGQAAGCRISNFRSRRTALLGAARRGAARHGAAREEHTSLT